MTDAERLLWSKLRQKQIKRSQFYRQRIIGDYIVDFYCPKRKLIIEVDGGQHYDDKVKARDRMRDDYMKGVGLETLRISDREVITNLNGVIEKIYEML
jgi:very-short-patch-repair endonuclease